MKDGVNYAGAVLVRRKERAEKKGKKRAGGIESNDDLWVDTGQARLVSAIWRAIGGHDSTEYAELER